jgi:hypothetical protein
MANFSNIGVTVNANVQGLTISQNNNSSVVPQGSIALGESIQVNTGSNQLIYSSGSAPTAIIASISVFNTTPSSSIALNASGSGYVSFLGNLSASNGATTIAWNAPLNSLWAQAYSVASTSSFIIITQ